MKKKRAVEHEDDLFAARMFELGIWTKKHRQAATVALILAAAGVASILYYRNYRKTLAVEASNQLEEILQSVALGDREGAKDDLIVFLESFGGTPHEGEARLLLGQLYLETSSAQQAIAVLEPMATSPRDPLELQAAALLATAYEQEGRWDDAEAADLRIAARSDLVFLVRPEDSPDRGLYEMRLAELEQHGSSG
jgi:predicted negative regulator of RcsB-dependent stress response